MNISLTNRVRAGLAVLLLGIPMLQAFAQEAAEDEDPPSRVARLSYRQGEVTLESAGSSAAETALLNRPLTTGDRLWVDENGRAELQSGSATLHLDESTGIEFTEVGDDSLRILLHDGAMNVHVRDLGRDEVIEIETPNTVVTLDEPGEYSIAAADGNTVVKVRDGSSTVAGIERGSRDYTVAAGRQGVFSGTAPISGEIGSVDPLTAFDRWSQDREQKSARSPTSRYVSREVIGYEDLDDHGDWRSDPEYGYVWYPRAVVSGWAPYRYGQWVWVRPWGWTWVDSAPWGFAPFHYGRWVHVRDHWGWVPGPRRIRPVYAPALVAWVGGPSVSVSVSFGSGIGWFPLGPREVYVPGYRVSRRYVNNVNVSNTVIVNNTYVTNVYDRGGRDVRYMHRDRPDGVTAVSRDDFTRGRPVDRHLVRWNDNDRRQIEVNTLRPEGADREERGNAVNRPSGWTENPRNATARRERLAEAQERRSREMSGVEREDPRRANSRDLRRDRSGGVTEMPGTAVEGDNARLRPNQPAVSSDKRDRQPPRGQPQIESTNPGNSSGDADRSDPRRNSAGRNETDRRRVYERQGNDRSSYGRSESRQPALRERERSAAEMPRPGLSQNPSDSGPRLNDGQNRGQERREITRGRPQTDGAGEQRSRPSLAPQGQKEEPRGGRQRQE